MPDGGRDFILATLLSGGRANLRGSAACIRWRVNKGFSKLSAGLAGQDDGVK